MGESQPRGSYCLDAACSTDFLVMVVLLSHVIWRCERARVSVEVFHFNPRTLTDVSVSSVPSASALVCNLMQFDAHERRMKFASLIIFQNFIH